KPLSFLLASSVIALSMPLGALAAVTDSAQAGGFELPINDKILSDASLPSLAPLPGLKASLKGQAAQSSAADKTSDVLQIEDVLKDEASPLTGVVESTVVQDDVLVVDNDEASVAETNEVWQELKDEPGMTKISSGACFPVVVSSALTSKLTRVGDPVEAALKTDIKIGGRLIAKKGDKVVGRVVSCYKARRMLHAELSGKRWMRANGAIGIQFDEIVTDKGEHLPLVAKPAQRSRIVKNVNEGRVLGVNDNGEIAGPLSTQLKHQAAHLAIRGAASAGGALSFGIVPVAYGIVGAINPSFAFLHPVGKNVPHRRLKGFAMGLASGVPGGFLIADTIIKGVEAEIKPGDEFLAQFHQDFTGEAATAASLIPGASQKVRGEVITPLKK
ncbi:MAG: hypothetical protein K2X93_17065, partial [Candidatus Obscuribacterales bacterium]|nr:hypothetical protein [Candidatus Obscuribacterales bacterium]